ncbi:hypothetical protein BDZ90DRAFT_176369 [Jaminaea rosea]|uniref:Uncharacterized protein n=1 Tax=Jaminaea rosea TaxID=1569628 RepID=A0A316UPY4_9BASI|nr:hypothetical protein BDZ90DRAFT_176369 [Jaminaea rosea]PWN27356.1 hypothetical protein BDZ90DRAFT_176369 [Jaminaea rosea]
MADVDTRPRSTPLQSDFNYPQQRTSSLDDALAGPSNIASYSNNSVAGPSNSVSSDPQDQLTSDFGMSAGGSSLYGGLLNGANSLDLTSSHHDNPLFTSSSSLSAVLPTLPDGLLQLPEVLDEDLSASSRLEFPDIPAMLFEQAPEYEYGRSITRRCDDALL